MVRELRGDKRCIGVVTSLQSLGSGLELQGKYEEAEGLSRKSLTMTKELYGENNFDVAISLRLLVSILKSQGKDAEADELECEILA